MRDKIGNKIQAILDRACKGTGHFIENINSVEVHVCKI